MARLTDGATFLVSGTTDRQPNVARCGRSLALFRLVAEPTNAYDENAVQVLYDGSIHVGYVSRKMSSLYREAVDRHESAGVSLGQRRTRTVQLNLDARSG